MRVNLPAYFKAKLLTLYQKHPTGTGFLLVGAAGFVLDIAVFFTLMHGLTLPPLLARILAFICAVVFTSLGNRRFTFKERQHRAVTTQLLLSAAIAFLAGCINLSTFYLLISSLPEANLSHIIAFTLGILMGMMINWLGSNKLSHKHIM